MEKMRLCSRIQNWNLTTSKGECRHVHTTSADHHLFSVRSLSLFLLSLQLLKKSESYFYLLFPPFREQELRVLWFVMAGNEVQELTDGRTDGRQSALVRFFCSTAAAAVVDQPTD